ncbi:hypothetical protein PFAG_01461 [Plasmodium falciparum Santa Lucia]|uniref:PWI domain-containing protein n=1 Tax=Plasmodium falciparum Santa Lucia TaxID=478859 RepID=W7G9V5_PLAFA|nr:hypothetical protein PFAG_01461 [Plasmodium falciparum Santa Lucia]
MLTKSKEEQKAYQTIITEKLRELLGEYEVDILTEYVWHMAGNAKSSNEFMCNELKDFLGDHTTVFVDWLMRLMGDIRKQKKSDTSLKNDKSNKSSSVREKQHDEYSKSNRSRDITYKRISDSADEYNNSEKKNKAVLKPNPRFVGDNPNPFMQPPTMMNNQEMSSYNMNNMPNFYQGNYVVGSKNMMDNSNNFISNNMNNNFVNSRYQNNIQPKNGKFLQNINNTSVSSSVNFMNTNRFNNNVNNNNYGFQKNNMINNNSNTNVVGTVPMDEQINNTQNFIKQNNNNMRNQQTFFSNTHNENNVNTHQYFTPKGNKQQIFNTNITNIDKQIKTQQQIQQNVNVVLPCDSHNTSNVQSVGEVSNNIQNDHMNDNMLNNALNTNEDEIIILYNNEDDFDKRNLSDTRRRSRSLASSKYSNEDMYFSKNRNKRRQKRGLSMRSVSSSSSTRKIHYDKNKSRNKRSDRGKDSDMFRLRDKYRRLGKSHSQSFSPSRVIYVENGQRKEKKNETHHDNVLNVKGNK